MSARTMSALVCLGLLAGCQGGSIHRSQLRPTSAVPAPSGATSYSVELPLSVRVVNAYSVAGVGQKVDVWSGSALSGKKLGTFDFGQVSDLIVPVRQSGQQAHDVGGQDVYSYTLSVYTEGGTDQAQRVSQNDAEAFAGDKFLYVVGAGLDKPQSFSPAAGISGILYTTTTSSGPGHVPLFDKAKVPAGKALLYVSAGGVPVAAVPDGATVGSDGYGRAGLTFDVGQPGSGCLPQIPLYGGDPVVGTNSRYLVSPAIGEAPTYVIATGTQQVFLYGSTDPGCKGKPIAGPFAVEASAGRAGLLLYGPPTAPLSLALPMG